MYYVTWYNEARVCYFVLMVWLLHYLYSLHADFDTSENIINIDLMGNLFNNGPKMLKLIVRVRIYINIQLEIQLENWILKDFFWTFIEVKRSIYIYIYNQLWIFEGDFLLNKIAPNYIYICMTSCGHLTKRSRVRILV